MTNIKIWQSLTLLSCTLSLELIGFPQVLQSVGAQTIPQTVAQSINPDSIVQFAPPPGADAPSSSRAGGHRGDGDSNETCNAQENAPLTALVPQNTRQWLTVASHPTLLVYFPQTTAKEGEFIIIDEQGNDYAVASFEIPDQPGIAKITIPETEKALEKDMSYTWVLEIFCDSTYGELVSLESEGFIKRIESDTVPNRESNPDLSLELAALYAENGFWFETIETLATLRQLQPNDVTINQEWENLLKSVGIQEEAVAEANIL